MALADFQALIGDLARDQGEVLSADTRARALEAARLQYSADRPRLMVDDVTWQADALAPVPTGWTESAWIKAAEYPIGSDPLSLIDVTAHLSPGGWQLMAAQYVPVGAQVRVTFMAEHELSATADTVPVMHRLAVAQYAAHLLCHQLATYYSAQRETMLGSDASMTETRAREFAARSKELRSAYYVGIGLTDPFKATGSASAPGSAAAGVVSWPSRNPRHRLVQRGGL
ncbi:hypothetical protein KIH07_02970 [Hydrogenophaga taeniospiralis]|uniref:hypothetical protein n=1 Tax=Hydrogenophaga taeniospiralis TaxID=65656 RepID=UPI001CFA644F|nr:hypothetical protein [Hydrogenophaga taeniospiralis]MCB4362678.1 hypothetical protein [Hydrogenophaga taeniospiralis]